MSSRSGSNSHRRHSRDPQDDPLYPPLPAPRLPSLRDLQSSRDRDSPSSSSGRPQTRNWSAAARRAERIRNFEDPGRSMDENWASTARRLRSSENRPSNFDDLDRSLDEANSHLRALLDMTNHTTFVNPGSIHISPDFSDENRRHKRRKLDSDRLASIFKGFRYGKYGQVEPGQLQMEIVTCDGGMFSNESSYAAENILKDDNSVYCTKGNRCNIILRHQGSTPFSLQELVIKAPATTNYSHPVREGMVFVSMDHDELLSRTAQYQIQYVTTDSSHPNDPSHLNNPTSLHDPSHSQQSASHAASRFSLSRRDLEPEPTQIISIRHHGDGTTSTRTRRGYIYRTNAADLDTGSVDTGSVDASDTRIAQMPPEFIDNVPAFNVTTQCSDDEDEDEYTGSGLRFSHRRPLNRIGSLPFETNDSDSDSAGPLEDGNIYRLSDTAIFRRTNGFTGLFSNSPGHEHSPYPSNSNPNSRQPTVTLNDAWEAHASATQDAIRAVSSGDGDHLLAPHARFFIEKKKTKCTIRFDPPVSGRFILLKMWSSHHDPTSNIDIQSVIVRGFAGPRSFPAVDLR